LDDHIELLLSIEAIPHVASILASCGGLLGGDKGTIEKLLHAKRQTIAPALHDSTRSVIPSLREMHSTVREFETEQRLRKTPRLSRERLISQEPPGTPVSKLANVNASLRKSRKGA